MGTGAAIEAAHTACVRLNILSAVVERAMTAVGDELPFFRRDITGPRSAGTGIEEGSSGEEEHDDGQDEEDSFHFCDIKS